MLLQEQADPFKQQLQLLEGVQPGQWVMFEQASPNALQAVRVFLLVRMLGLPVGLWW